MSQFLLKKIPESIYTLHDQRGLDALREASHALAKWIRTRAKDGQAVTDYNLRAVRANPLVCAYLGYALECYPALQPALNDNVAGVFFALTSDDNYEQMSLETERSFVVPGNGEFVFAFLLWAKKNQKLLRLPPADYEEALLSDPYWGAQAVHSGLISVGNFIVRMRQWVEENRDIDSGAAFSWLLQNDDEPVGDLAKVIHMNPFYSYLSLHYLRRRGFRMDSSPLTTMTPRWAYHCLNFGYLIDDRRLLREFLMKDPGWLVEYIVTQKMLDNPNTIPKAYEFYVDCVDVCHPHPLIQPMHDFFDRHKEKIKPTAATTPE
jgi:hypothetical protein